MIYAGCRGSRVAIKVERAHCGGKLKLGMIQLLQPGEAVEQAAQGTTVTTNTTHQPLAWLSSAVAHYLTVGRLT